MIAPPVQRGNQGELLLARKCLMRSGVQNGWITPWIPTGRRILGLLCKMSLSPDFCVSQTETAFTREPARSGRPWSRGEESQSGFNSCLPCHLRPRITLLECDLGKTPKLPRVQPFAFLGL